MHQPIEVLEVMEEAGEVRGVVSTLGEKPAFRRLRGHPLWQNPFCSGMRGASGLF